MVNFSKQGGQLAAKFKAEGEQALASITLQKIECLASKLVFATNGLVLGLSMALIPTETT